MGILLLIVSGLCLGAPIPTALPFLEEKPELGRSAPNVTTVAQQALPVILAALSFTPLGAPAGIELSTRRKQLTSNRNPGLVAAIVQFFYGGGRSSLFQFTGATPVASPLGMILAAAIGTGNTLVKNGESVTNEIPFNPPGQQYLLTPPAVQAIVKAWKITPYDPPSTDVSGWLSKVRELCREYEVPATQQVLCATHLMRADCRKVTIAAKCQDMTWDEFATWLLKYDSTCFLDGSLPAGR